MLQDHVRKQAEEQNLNESQTSLLLAQTLEYNGLPQLEPASPNKIGLASDASDQSGGFLPSLDSVIGGINNLVGQDFNTVNRLGEAAPTGRHFTPMSHKYLNSLSKKVCRVVDFLRITVILSKTLLGLDLKSGTLSLLLMEITGMGFSILQYTGMIFGCASKEVRSMFQFKINLFSISDLSDFV